MLLSLDSNNFEIQFYLLNVDDQSETFKTSGVTNSECLMPREKAGARALLTVTFSGLYSPGPGFLVASLGILCRPSIENAGCRGR